ncbi:MAG: ABC transporter permease [Cryomorphaceae bacterium]|nr:ABC transporter permease [Cryomorphaceae bacterium]
MGKIAIIIRREYLSRVRKKSFLILTLVGPILFAILAIAPSAIMLLPDEERIILVLDQPNLMDQNKGSDEVQFQYANPDKYTVDKIKEMVRTDEKFYAALFVPSGESWDPDFISKNITFFSRGDVNVQVQSFVSSFLQKQITNEKLRVMGVDPELISGAKTNVSIRNIDVSKEEESETSAGPKMAVGFLSGFLIYFFIFIYGSMVMRSVIEEKTNRIVEVIISSVKPFQLLMGKIAGVALVGITQFAIWVVLTSGIVFAVSAIFLGNMVDPESLIAGQNLGGDDEISAAVITGLDYLGMINFPLIISCFLFYFIGGYLLYGSFMAAVGSAVDSETDAQQFVLPVSIPLILSIIVLMRIMTNPDSTLITVLSMVPLTSPIIMMARLPFGVPIPELLLSMALLIGAILLSVWIAGKIYRTGILMYGKKPTFKELYKWLFFRE